MYWILIRLVVFLFARTYPALATGLCLAIINARVTFLEVAADLRARMGAARFGAARWVRDVRQTYRWAMDTSWSPHGPTDREYEIACGTHSRAQADTVRVMLALHDAHLWVRYVPAAYLRGRL